MTASVWSPSNSGIVLSNLNRVSTETVAGVGQTSFAVLVPYTVGAENLEVYKNGIKLLPSVVTEVTGGATFVIGACAGGEKIESVVYPATAASFTQLAAQADASAIAAAGQAAAASASAALAAAYSGGWQTANNTFSGANQFQNTVSVIDAGFSIADDVDATKKVKFQVSGVSAGQTRTVTIPDADIVLGTGAGGFKNKIINGDFNIWQRSTASVALTNAAAYGSADRWAALQDVTAVSSVQQSASAPTGFKYSLRVGRTAANAGINAIRFGTALESINSIPLQGQTVTLSFYAKAGANFSAAGNLLYAYINEGQGTDQPVANAISASWASNISNQTTKVLTAGWVRYSYTVTLNAATTQVAAAFNYIPAGVAGADDNVYITGVQLELGGAATTFESRPIAVELALCQRYYQQVGGNGVGNFEIVPIFGYQTSTTTGILLYFSKVKLRTAPSFAYSALLDWTVQNAGIATQPTVFTLDGGVNQTPDAISHSVTWAGAGGSSSLFLRLVANNSAAARLTYSSEL